MNYARRQQYRRLFNAGKAALGSVVALLLGVVVANGGAAPLAGLLLLIAAGLGLYARHWLSLARRSRVGARSEDEVRRALAPLEPEGWRLRHSLGWRGRGDIDSVAIAPTGVAVAIETKTRSYDDRHPHACGCRPCGCRGGAGDGVAGERCRSYVLFARAGWSTSSGTSWWSRSIG